MALYLIEREREISASDPNPIPVQNAKKVRGTFGLFREHSLNRTALFSRFIELLCRLIWAVVRHNRKKWAVIPF